MWATIENYIFLGLLFGVPLALAAVLLRGVVRWIREPDPLLVLHDLAIERGWSGAPGEGRGAFRYEGSHDGVPFTISRARLLRRGGSHGHRAAPPVIVTMPFEATPGCFVVQRTMPPFLSGDDGKLVSTFFAGVADLVLDDEQARTLATLTAVPGSSDGTPFTAYATEPNHPLVPAGTALAHLLAAQAKRTKADPMVYVREGQLTLSSRRPECPYAELVELAAECHRKLTALRDRPLR